jgi:cell wall-associated NlpC family hydrolase
MSTIAWLLILSAVLILRAVAKGRALDLPQDLGDAFQAFINGDYDSLAEVAGRTGDTATVSQASSTEVSDAISNTLSQVQKSLNQNVAYWAYQLGKAAKGYRFNTAGPAYYDCSGLMYRAVQKVGYTGPRFWTGSVALMPGMHKLASTGMGISQVTTGDLVVWPGHHMGVVVGVDRFYSALNPKAGIAERKITGFRKESPIYLRFTPPGK